MAQKVLSEVHMIKHGTVCRKIYFIEADKEWCVYELELQEDRYRPIGKDNVWKQTFFLPCPQRNLARAAFIGRQAQAAYEECNTGE